MEQNTPNNSLSKSVIRFDCTFCGKQICVPSIHAGKKGKCPKCKNIIVIPPVETSAESVPDKADTANIDYLFQQVSKSEGVEAQKQFFTEEQQLEALRQSTGLTSLIPEPPPERNYPWLIDIFLYPANRYGLIFMGIAFLIPLLIQLIIILLVLSVGIVAVFFAIPSVIITIPIIMFACWFLAECIRDSASGGLRVPNTMAETPGLAEMGLRLVRLFVCFAVCIAPVYFYYKTTRQTGTTLWFLAGFGAFIFPMALLSVIMFDSISGLNPLIIIPSLFSSFVQYCCLVLFIVVIVFL